MPIWVYSKLYYQLHIVHRFSKVIIPNAGRNVVSAWIVGIAAPALNDLRDMINRWNFARLMVSPATRSKQVVSHGFYMTMICCN